MILKFKCPYSEWFLTVISDYYFSLFFQLKWRLREGQGEAIYEIGVEDNGVLAGLSSTEMTASLQTLRQMALSLGATTTILRERWLEDTDADTDGSSSNDSLNGNTMADQRKVVEVLVRKVRC